MAIKEKKEEMKIITERKENNNETKNNIPLSVIVADAKKKVADIVNHPILPPYITEMILKDAWQTLAVRSSQLTQQEFEKYCQENKEGDKK